MDVNNSYIPQNYILFQRELLRSQRKIYYFHVCSVYVHHIFKGILYFFRCAVQKLSSRAGMNQGQQVVRQMGKSHAQ